MKYKLTLWLMINLFRMVAVFNPKKADKLGVSVIVPTQKSIFFSPEPPLAEWKLSDVAGLWVDLNLYVVSMRHVLPQEFRLHSEKP